MSEMEEYKPKGTTFYDYASGRNLLLVLDGSGWDGWLAYQHPDGQWVSLRKASEDDLHAINHAVVVGHHGIGLEPLQIKQEGGTAAE